MSQNDVYNACNLFLSLFIMIYLMATPWQEWSILANTLFVLELFCMSGFVEVDIPTLRVLQLVSAILNVICTAIR